MDARPTANLESRTDTPEFARQQESSLQRSREEGESWQEKSELADSHTVCLAIDPQLH